MPPLKRFALRAKRKLRLFRRLQWRLTLAYTLSTVVTAILLAVIGLVLLWYINFRSGMVPRLIADGLLKATPALLPYLQETPPDRAALQRWLNGVTSGNHLIIPLPAENSGDDVDTIPGQFGRVMLVAIVDPAGIVLASQPAKLAYSETAATLMRPSRQDIIDAPAEVFLASIPLMPLLQTEEAKLFQAALRGVADPRSLATRDSDGNLIAAAPVLDSHSNVMGAIFVKLAFPIEEREFVQSTLVRLIIPFVVGLVVVGGAAGVVFGLLIARQMTRRLQLLAQAADEWSHGNFTALAHDAKGDELSHLARHLNHMAIELQGLLETRHELATMEERNRLARELHDSVKQQVFATAMQVGAARALLDQDPDAARACLLEAEHMVGQAQKELTTLIRELRPAALEGQGLAAALRRCVSDWSRQNQIPVDLRIRGERPMPLPLERALYRVAQEAMTNIARHSQAHRVEIDLVWQNSDITLTITDNGQGFDVKARAGKGVGLESMQERIESLGGTFRIQSQPGAGCRVVAQLPLSG